MLRFEVTVLRREGRVIPKWQHAFGGNPTGFLLIEEYDDGELERTVRVARFHRTDKATVPHDRYTELIPLQEPHIVYSSPEMMVLAGIENVPTTFGDRQEFAQAWILRAAK